jgi:hypothetical protein
MSIYCRVDVYILPGRCLYTAGSMSIYCRVDVYILQGRCLYTAGSMSIYCRVYVYILQGRCLYTAHRTELTFRPCRVDVYILHTEQNCHFDRAGSMSIYFTQNRTDISTVQGRCRYTAHRTDMTVVYISTVQGRCLYTAHRTDMTVVYIYLYLLVPGRRGTCFYI